MLDQMIRASKELRRLNDALDVVSEQVDGIKSTVKQNVVLSIVIGSVVAVLLLLCWCLRRKYYTPTRIISKRDYERAKSKMERRTQDIKGDNIPSFPVKLNASSETRSTHQDELIEDVEMELIRKSHVKNDITG